MVIFMIIVIICGIISAFCAGFCGGVVLGMQNTPAQTRQTKPSNIIRLTNKEKQQKKMLEINQQEILNFMNYTGDEMPKINPEDGLK
ncbi:MAG: hypothetical protein PHR24_01740 [Oscillospiraceae bacterium]|nr:hypothetical protein [Oscillospiraceae bacterium]MDD3832671.1 hypothetical protein [Oscillospiraceae bacterium]MDD4546001.1 hypothetical protein [Oscillospiraceae bacterium]